MILFDGQAWLEAKTARHVYGALIRTEHKQVIELRQHLHKSLVSFVIHNKTV